MKRSWFRPKRRAPQTTSAPDETAKPASTEPEAPPQPVTKPNEVQEEVAPKRRVASTREEVALERELRASKREQLASKREQLASKREQLLGSTAETPAHVAVEQLIQNPARESRDEEIDDLLAAMTVETQQKTKQSVQRTKAKLEETLKVADETNSTLQRQHEQIDSISADLDSAKQRVETTEKRFNEYEKWRIFGGRSKKHADRAEAQYLAEQKRNDERADKLKETYGRTHTPIERAPHVAGSHTSSPARFQDVTAGLVARNDAEQAKLDEVAANDSEINEGLEDISKLLTRLEDKAYNMHDGVQRQNADIEHTTGQISDVNMRVARVNARAQHNLRRAGVR